MRRIIKCFFGLCLVILLALAILNNASIIKADSGWDTDYDSGGSWDSGSDWSDSSWDSDSDWGDSSWDLDYGNNDGYSSTFSEDGIFMVAYLIIIVFFTLVIVNTLKNTKNQSSTNTNIVDNTKYKELTQEQVNEILPSLNVLEFNFKAYQMFYDVQMAWMDFEYDKLKENLTDELYNSYVMQLDILKSKNHKNVMKDFELIESHIFDLKEENGLYIAKVFLKVKFKDYVENVNTGIITRGSINNKVCNTYILTFICTKEKSHNINECPNCGAEVKGNATGTCEYCKSKLINKKYNWIMSKKEKIKQR